LIHNCVLRQRNEKNGKKYIGELHRETPNIIVLDLGV